MSGSTLDVLVVTADAGAPWDARNGLAARGFAVRRTETAEAALASAAGVPPDVILMDLTTPGVDGPALDRALRGQPRGNKPPLVVVSILGHATAADDRVPVAVGVELPLCLDGPLAAGVVVGVLSRFREFLAALPSCADAAPADGRPGGGACRCRPTSPVPPVNSSGGLS